MGKRVARLAKFRSTAVCCPALTESNLELTQPFFGNFLHCKPHQYREFGFTSIQEIYPAMSHKMAHKNATRVSFFLCAVLPLKKRYIYLYDHKHISGYRYSLM